MPKGTLRDIITYPMEPSSTEDSLLDSILEKLK